MPGTGTGRRALAIVGAFVLGASGALVLLLAREHSAPRDSIEPGPSRRTTSRNPGLPLVDEGGQRRTAIVEAAGATVPAAASPAGEAPGVSDAPAVLSLSIVDARGSGIANLAVSIEAEGSQPRVLDQLQLFETLDGWSATSRSPAHVTDRSGHIALEAPSRRELVVHVSDHSRTWPMDRIADRMLSTGPLGEPIVLEPGEILEASVRFGLTLLARGSVLLADGTPVAGANLRVFDADPSLFGTFESTMQDQSGPHGEFTFVLHDLLPDCELWIAAIDGEWVSMQEQGPLHAAIVEMRATRAIAGTIETEIVLDPTLEIAGRVIDEHGESFGGVVWAVPASAEYVLQKLGVGYLPITPLSDGGCFTIRGLPEGMYDVVVKRNSPRTYHRFDGFRSGDCGIELRILEDRVVHIHLRVEAPSGSLRTQPVLLKHQYRSARSPRSTGSVQSPMDGAEPADIHAEAGEWSEEDDEGRTIQRVEEPVSSSTHDFEPQQVGWYTVGVRAWDAEGRPFAPRFSEPVYLVAGDHEFVANLAR